MKFPESSAAPLPTKDSTRRPNFLKISISLLLLKSQDVGLRQLLPSLRFRYAAPQIPIPNAAVTGSHCHDNITTYNSEPLILGPVEFRLDGWTSGVAEPSFYRYVNCADMEGYSFPWEGTVSCSLRILDAEGKHVKYEESLRPMQLQKKYKCFSVLEEDPLFFKYLSWATVKKHADEGALHLELVLVLNVSLKSPAGGEAWRIPRSLLNITNTVGINPDLLGSKEFSDVELESREGNRVPVHRVILAGRSAVFKTMFATEMMEKAEGVVRIGDMGIKALNVMLKFIYTGEFQQEMEDFAGYDAEVFLELVNAGEKYELPLLMTLAGVALLLRCTRENAWDLCLALEKYGEGMYDILSQLQVYMEKLVCDLARHPQSLTN